MSGFGCRHAHGVLAFPHRKIRSVARLRPHAFSVWRGPLRERGSKPYLAVCDGLRPVWILRQPQWRARLDGDAAAAIGTAIALAFAQRPSAQLRDIVLSALWLRASDGDAAARVVLDMIRRENGRFSA
jgi:hypothetical protein